MIPVLPECREPEQQFCELCRDRERGLNARKTILRIRGIDAPPDFECPLEKPWGLKSSMFGDKLHRLLAAKYGIRACAPCAEQVREMNQMSREQAIEAKQEILEGIWSRRNQLPAWKRMALRLPSAKHLALRELGKLYDEALK